MTTKQQVPLTLHIGRTRAFWGTSNAWRWRVTGPVIIAIPGHIVTYAVGYARTERRARRDAHAWLR